LVLSNGGMDENVPGLDALCKTGMVVGNAGCIGLTQCAFLQTNGRPSVCSRYYGQCDYYGSLSMLLLGWVIPAMIIGMVFSMCFYCRRRRVIQQMKVHNEHHAVHQQHVEANGGIPFAVPAEEYGQYNAVDPPVAQPAPETSGRGPPAVSGFAMAARPVTVRPQTVSGSSMGATGRAGFS